MSKRVVIIGGGFAGLSSAALFARAGHDVQLFEKNEQFGGRAGVFSTKGFRFDMGPSWYLMPDVFDDFFAIFGKKVSDYIELKRLDPSYKVYFKDRGKQILIAAELAKNQENLEKLETGSYEQLQKYLVSAEVQYKIAVREFIYKNYVHIGDFFTHRMLTQGPKLSVFSTMNSYVGKYFKSTELQQLVQYPLVFLGASPYNAPALYNIMSHVDFNMGVFYPKKGIYSLTESLVQLARENGAMLKTKAAVRAIRTVDARATSVELESGRVIPADIVISGADIWHTEQLLPVKKRDHSPHYWEKRVLAPSALLIYLGIKGRVKNVSHHTLIFSNDWQKNFTDIFNDKQLPTDPSLYICTPSKTDPTVAPKGHENMFVLVPIPAGINPSTKELNAYAEAVIETIAIETKNPNLKERIVYKKVFGPSGFLERYNSLGGSALGLAHTFKQTAIFRPSNKSKKISNLYYTGANTNPGIGLPMALISSQLVYKRVHGIKA